MDGRLPITPPSPDEIRLIKLIKGQDKEFRWHKNGDINSITLPYNIRASWTPPLDVEWPSDVGEKEKIRAQALADQFREEWKSNATPRLGNLMDNMLNQVPGLRAINREINGLGNEITYRVKQDVLDRIRKSIDEMVRDI
ncbi:MAG: hypothetical protein KGJ06_06125 [Pseudomonadota bacterium]|nr:hypothetical protein [Pseudomonadota bacterium]